MIQNFQQKVRETLLWEADKWHLMFTYKIIYNENVKYMKIRMCECVKGRNKYNENYIQNPLLHRKAQ